MREYGTMMLDHNNDCLAAITGERSLCNCKTSTPEASREAVGRTPNEKDDAPSMEGKEEDADSPLGNVEWEGLK